MTTDIFDVWESFEKMLKKVSGPEADEFKKFYNQWTDKKVCIEYAFKNIKIILNTFYFYEFTSWNNT